VSTSSKETGKEPWTEVDPDQKSVVAAPPVVLANAANIYIESEQISQQPGSMGNFQRMSAAAQGAHGGGRGPERSGGGAL
jgi:hypothetical protein